MTQQKKPTRSHDRTPAKTVFPDEEWIWEAAVRQAEAEMRTGGQNAGTQMDGPVLSKTTAEGIAPSLRQAIQAELAEYEIPAELVPILNAEMRRCAARALETMDQNELEKLIAAGRRVNAKRAAEKAEAPPPADA